MPEEKQLTLDELAELWSQTKAAVTQHQKDLLNLEEAILKQIEVRDEGSKTTSTDHYRITATTRMNRKVDWDKYDGIVHDIPEALRPEKIKRELDTTGIKWLANNEPDVYRKLALAIESKPGKTGFKIERLKED